VSDCGVGQLSWPVTNTENLSVAILVLVYHQHQHATGMRTVKTAPMSCTAVRCPILFAVSFILTLTDVSDVTFPAMLFPGGRKSISPVTKTCCRYSQYFATRCCFIGKKG